MDATVSLEEISSWYSACIATSPDDLNWIPWLAVAHPDKAAVGTHVLEPLYKEFVSSHPEFFDEEFEGWEDIHHTDDQVVEALNEFLSDHGYITFQPGQLVWMCPG